ncbi:MAG: hypothetical protein IJ068_03145 [Bacilli bacterium]|nr:hypothetical protein [Bacilli bacterium]
MVDEQELEKIKSSKYISSGDEGICYLYRGLIFKLYRELMHDRKIDFDYEVSQNIAFPNDILISIDNKKILGYTMNLLNGINLKNGFVEDLELNDLKNAYKNIRREIERFSYIDMNNISLTNILYDYINKEFNIIDTSLWTLKGNSNNKNIERFNYILIRCLSITLDWNRYILNSKQILFDLYGMHLNGESYFIEFLTELEMIVSELKNEKVKKIKDLII